MIKKLHPLYWLIRNSVWLVYKKYKLVGVENLPNDPVVLVGNHSKANGPIVAQLYPPRETYTWCVGEMMNVKEVPEYAFNDFWSKKPKFLHPLYHFLSYLIAPLSAFIMTNALTVGVYKDKRIFETFNKTVELMELGADIIVFPECYDEHNNIVHDFQKGFVEIGRYYYRKTKKRAPFVPMYVCPELKLLVFGKPTYYDPDADKKEENERIRQYLMDGISEIAYDLPRHQVIQYPNIPKKDCPYNDRLD